MSAPVQARVPPRRVPGGQGGGGTAPARSCPFPAYMTCRRMAEERGFRHPCQSRAPSSLQTGSKSRSPLAPTPLGGGGRAPAAPGRAHAAFVPPVSGGARGEAGAPSPLALSLSPSRGLAGAAPGHGHAVPPPPALVAAPAAGAATPAVCPSPSCSRSSRATRSPARWSIRTRFQSHGS